MMGASLVASLAASLVATPVPTFGVTLVGVIGALTALIELILALYVLVMNVRLWSNRLIAVLMGLLSIYTFSLTNYQTLSAAINLPAAVNPPAMANLPEAIGMLSAAAILPVYWLVCLAILRPDFERLAWKHPVKLAPVLLAAYPLLLAGAAFAGLSNLQAAAPLLLTLNILLPWLATVGWLAYRLVSTRTEAAQPAAPTVGGQPESRRAAINRAYRKVNTWLLAAALLAGLPVLFGSPINTVSAPAGAALGANLPSLAASLGFLIAFSVILFSSNALLTIQSSTIVAGSARSMAGGRRGSIQTRLTALILIVALPLLAAATAFLTRQAQQQLEANALQVLASANRAVTENTGTWLEYNTRALQTLIENPDIFNMIALVQKPVLREFATTYPHMYLVSTTDLEGRNLARSDDAALANYADRRWFRAIVEGAPIAYQALIGRTNNRPALVVAMPVKDPQPGDAEPLLVGVGMFASDLSEISTLAAGDETDPGAVQVFLLDESGQLIVHSDPSRPVLQDFSAHPAFRASQAGAQGALRYTSEDGQPWRAHVATLPNGWIVAAEQSEATLFAPIRAFQVQAAAILAISALLLFTLAWFTIRQSLEPVRSLNATAAAITDGDLTRLAPVESQDELGELAESFNSMTVQLRELIRGLESRVAERTRDLERRVVQLRATAEVAREAAAIRSQEQLFQDTVRLISERFGFYHAGIFLIEGHASGGSEEGAPGVRYAVLKAASSEGGARMLTRRHRLQVGQVGIVGSVAASGQPRIALDVGKDAAYFNNPDLPDTRSEMALPLKVQDQVIGVLDVQSRKPSAFSEDDLAILQVLADQIALAIQNTRLLEESRQALSELESLYGMQFRQGWKARLARRARAYRFDYRGVTVSTPDGALVKTPGEGLTSPLPPPDRGGSNDELAAPVGLAAPVELAAPIRLRGRRLGVVRLRRTSRPEQEAQAIGEAPGWSEAEAQVLEDAVEQLALALENARLLEEIQDRATQEEMINRVVARAQSSLNLETVMRTAAQEIGAALNVSRLRIRLGQPNEPAEPQTQQPQGEQP